MADYRLAVQPGPAIAAFLRGFHDLVPRPWVASFHAAELQTLVSGVEGGLDLADLRANINYAGACGLFQ